MSKKITAHRIENIRDNGVRRYHYELPSVDFYNDTHKGDYGHTLIIGGGKGMFGAAALSAVSALKVGTGKSSIYSHDLYQQQYHVADTPIYEVMKCASLTDLSAYSAVVLGPGLGRDDWGKQVYHNVVTSLEQSPKPLLIDADGLYHLALHKAHANAIDIITPHEAEAARLLATSVTAIRDDKIAAVQALARRYHCLAVLKGAGTLVSDGTTVWQNSSGNINLATAGSGDVLAGMIGGYLAQDYAPLDATLYAVYRHGSAADGYLAKHNTKSMRASDLWAFL